MTSTEQRNTRFSVGLVVVAATALFAAALFFGRHLGHWLTTTIAATISIGLAWRHSGTKLRLSLAPSKRPVALGLLSGLILSAMTHVAYPIVASHLAGFDGEVRSLYALLETPPGRFFSLPLLAFVVIAEESVWRGILYPALRTRFSVAPAVVLASIAYTLPQLAGGSWVLSALALSWGLLWTSQRALTGSLLVPTLTHLVWDILIFLVIPIY